MKHLRSISEIGLDAVSRILDLTEHMVEVNARPNPKVPALRGRTVCNMFFEDSTRTRLSFETAAKRLSADVMTFTAGSSSVNKGESLRDTIETVAAMGVDAFVIRHKSSGVPWQVERWTTARSSPLGAQLASNTSSRTSRGVPPFNGTRARVPLPEGTKSSWRLSRIATSPFEEFELTSALDSPSGRDSVPSVRTVKISAGAPSQAAAYATVCPSGVNRADSMLPRRNVRR